MNRKRRHCNAQNVPLAAFSAHDVSTATQPALPSLNGNPAADCPHDEIFDSMCALCGAIVTRRKNYRVSDASAPVNGSLVYVPQRSANALILDIDNTLLVVRTHDSTAPHRAAEHWPDLNIDVLWRPGIIAHLTALCARFAHDASKRITFFIHTKGTRAYANHVRERLNELVKNKQHTRTSELVAPENVITRDEERGAHKSLRHFFAGDDPRALILDDRVDVWLADASHVLQVAPFTWPNEESAGVNFDLSDEFALIRRIFDDPSPCFASTLRRILHNQPDAPLPTDQEIADLVTAIYSQDQE